jgi:hypothetical protein
MDSKTIYQPTLLALLVLNGCTNSRAVLLRDDGANLTLESCSALTRPTSNGRRLFIVSSESPKNRIIDSHFRVLLRGELSGLGQFSYASAEIQIFEAYRCEKDSLLQSFFWIDKHSGRLSGQFLYSDGDRTLVGILEDCETTAASISELPDPTETLRCPPHNTGK